MDSTPELRAAALRRWQRDHFVEFSLGKQPTSAELREIGEAIMADWSAMDGIQDAL